MTSSKASHSQSAIFTTSQKNDEDEAPPLITSSLIRLHSSMFIFVGLSNLIVIVDNILPIIYFLTLDKNKKLTLLFISNVRTVYLKKLVIDPVSTNICQLILSIIICVKLKVKKPIVYFL